MYLQEPDSPAAIYRGPSARDVFHDDAPAECGQPLGCLDPDKDLDGFTNQVRVIHTGIGGFHRALIKFIVNGDRGPYGDSLRIRIDAITLRSRSVSPGLVTRAAHKEKDGDFHSCQPG
jgi:hypothetical protein